MITLQPCGTFEYRFYFNCLREICQDARIWKKLQNPISKSDLLQAVLDEFEVEKAVSAADLDALLTTLKGYGVIEDD